MAVFTITYEAKCKHCRHFEYEYKTKKDGTRSKVKRYYCAVKNKTWDLSMKEKACDKLEL
jgi:hypothetical protein